MTETDLIHQGWYRWANTPVELQPIKPYMIVQEALLHLRDNVNVINRMAVGSSHAHTRTSPDI
jgi:hypothetical protein